MGGRATAMRQATAWLGHPVTVVALAVLLLNDHVLKPAYGTWWTGKLSDVAGLVAAPALVGVLVALVVPRASLRLVAGVALAVVGAGFAVVKATSMGAAAASEVWTWVAGPSRVLADRTDLLVLPALWPARWAVRRVGRTDPRSADRPSRWFRLGVVLPVAVLAVGATSQGAMDGPTQIATVDGRLFVGTGYGSEKAYAWYRTSDGVTWESMRSYQDEYDDLAAQVAAAGGPTTLACEPADADVCYRAGEDRLLVERSTDGGRTWQVDWSVPPDVVAQLYERYQTRRPPLETRGVAILETATGPAVYAANGGDGLAVRHPDGTWERLGLAYLTDPEPVVPLPGERTAYDFPIPPLVVLALAVACVALLVRRRIRGEDVEPSTSRVRGAIAAGALIVGVVLAFGVGARVVHGQGVYFIQYLLLVPPFVVGAALLLSGLAALGRRPPHDEFTRPEY